MKNYLVTIAPRVEKYHTKESLDAEWVKIRKKIRGAEWSDVVSYEIDKRNRLHMHTMMCRKKAVQNPFQYATKEHSIHITLIDDGGYETVRNYILKNAYNEYEQEQILIMNYYQHNYGFI